MLAVISIALSRARLAIALLGRICKRKKTREGDGRLAMESVYRTIKNTGIEGRDAEKKDLVGPCQRASKRLAALGRAQVDIFLSKAERSDAKTGVTEAFFSSLGPACKARVFVFLARSNLTKRSLGGGRGFGRRLLLKQACLRRDFWLARPALRPRQSSRPLGRIL